jgi:hypothetical protein
MIEIAQPQNDRPKNAFLAVLDGWPPIMSKKEIAARFDCDFRKLRRCVLTDEVLQLADIPIDQYAKIRGGFSADETARLNSALCQKFTLKKI